MIFGKKWQLEFQPYGDLLAFKKVLLLMLLVKNWLLEFQPIKMDGGCCRDIDFAPS